MARAADKKLQKAAQSNTIYYQIALTIFTGIQLFRIQNFSELSWMTLIGQAFLMIMAYFSYTLVVEGLRTGTGSDYPLDIFVLNGLVQILTTVHSDNWWYLYLLVPAFILYKASGLIMSYCKRSGGASTETKEEKSKRQIKKEKLQEKFGGSRVM